MTLLDAPSGTADVTYTYDNLGRMLTAGSGSVSVTRTWDALGRMTSEAGRLGTYGFQYDIAGRRTRITWPDGYYAQYTWDLSDQITRIGENGATSGVGILAAYAYDNLGQRTGVTRGNGASTSYAYDGAGRTTSIAHNLTGTANDVTLGFTYNPASQIATRTVSNPLYAFTPTNGTTSYVNNGRNEVTSAGGASVTYDANRNIASDGVDHFTYDAFNRLTHTDGRHYAYDALGQLTAAGTREISIVGGMPTGVHASDASVIRRFVPGPGTNEYVGYYTSADVSSRLWLALDERNSPMAYTDAAGGTSYRGTYDEYGQLNPAEGHFIRYAGMFVYNDGEGLYYAQNRFYHPRLGRFLQTDPIGYGDGANMYAYVGNDPVNRVDPTGLARLTYDCSYVTSTLAPDGLSFTVDYHQAQCYVDIPDPYPTGNRDRSGRGHGFSLARAVCPSSSTVSNAAALEGLRRTPFPGWNPRKLITNNRTSAVHGRLWSENARFPGGWVTTRYDSSTLTLKNRTTQFHVFRGETERGYRVGSDGTLFSYVVGRGVSNFPLADNINDIAGPHVFDEVLNIQERWFNDNVPGC